MRPITYPARPVNGGPLDKALPKHGLWSYEPKYNGWRVLVHTPSGTLFNRRGERLSIAGEFRAALLQLKETSFEWLDAEALERRHGIGRGSLIVFDCILPGSFQQRRQQLEAGFGAASQLGAFETCGRDQVRLPSLSIKPFELWTELQQANRILGCEFYEGAVAKRADSTYPIQLLSLDKEFPFWMKHRWKF